MTEEAVVIFGLSGTIVWAVEPTDESRIALAGLAGWSLLHPALFPQQQFPVGDGSFLISVAAQAG